MSKINDFCKDNNLNIINSENEKRIIQRSNYIEDGWFIVSNKEETEFSVFKSPLFGGEEDLIDIFKTIEEAYICAMELC
jgi:hypothetical protein